MVLVGTGCLRKYWGLVTLKMCWSELFMSLYGERPWIYMSVLSNTPALRTGKCTPADEIIVKNPIGVSRMTFVCECVSLLNSLWCNYRALLCADISPSVGVWFYTKFSSVFHCRPFRGLSRGRPCGLPLQWLQFIKQPALICSSRGFPAFSKPPRASLNPGAHWTHRQQGCTAVKPHSIKQILSWSMLKYLDQCLITSWLLSGSSGHFPQCLNPGSSPNLFTSSEQRATALNIYHADAGHQRRSNFSLIT